jgi:putative endonuclease
MHYVYVLRSLKDGKLYTGYSTDLRRRIDEHNKGYVKATKNRHPFELIYYEACTSHYDAYRREKYLKTNYGRRYIQSRLKDYFENYSTGQGQE